MDFVGVDGCKIGWFFVRLRSGNLDYGVASRLANLVAVRRQMRSLGIALLASISGLCPAESWIQNYRDITPAGPVEYGFCLRFDLAAEDGTYAVLLGSPSAVRDHDASQNEIRYEHEGAIAFVSSEASDDKLTLALHGMESSDGKFHYPELAGDAGILDNVVVHSNYANKTRAFRRSYVFTLASYIQHTNAGAGIKVPSCEFP